MTAGKLHHIEIYVSDLSRSIVFWDWLLTLLSYEPYQEWDEGKSWKLDETYLVLVQTEKEYLDVPYCRKHTGLNHLAFHAASRKQLDEITKLAQEKGVTILYPEKQQHTEDYYSLYLEDPDRIKVELVSSTALYVKTENENGVPID
jgi:catechol 2,3-dioxygenase-like lactoylglutathione lyase family enzyme